MVDSDQREAFASLFAKLDEVGRDARVGRVLAEETSADVKKLGVRVTVLESVVFGSAPPPPPSLVAPEALVPESPVEGPLVSRVSTAEASQDAAAAREIVLERRVATIEHELGAVKRLNVDQSKAMGIAPAEASMRERASKFFYSREGAKFVLALATLVSAIGALLQGVSK